MLPPAVPPGASSALALPALLLPLAAATLHICVGPATSVRWSTLAVDALVAAVAFWCVVLQPGVPAGLGELLAVAFAWHVGVGAWERYSTLRRVRTAAMHQRRSSPLQPFAAPRSHGRRQLVAHGRRAAALRHRAAGCGPGPPPAPPQPPPAHSLHGLCCALIGLMAGAGARAHA